MRKLSTYIAGVAKRPLPARVTERAKHDHNRVAIGQRFCCKFKPD